MNLSKRNVHPRSPNPSANNNLQHHPPAPHTFRNWLFKPRLRLQHIFALLCLFCIFNIAITLKYFPPPSKQPFDNTTFFITSSVVDITPSERVWQSGFSSRNRTVDSTIPLHPSPPLFAKAISIRTRNPPSHQQPPLLLLTLDLVGIDRNFSHRIHNAALHHFNLPVSHLRILPSHTHSGPVVCQNLFPISVHTPPEMRKIHTYCETLLTKITLCIGNAISDANPLRVHPRLKKASVPLAVNRRQLEEQSFHPSRRGLVDDDVPILWFETPQDGKLVAGLYGYAAHATILTSSYQYSGDYPALTSAILENHFDRSVWLFAPGCGGDINIYPRGTTARLVNHAHTLSNAIIGAVSEKSNRPSVLNPRTHREALSATYATLHLPFSKRLDKKRLRQMRRSAVSEERATSAYLLQNLENDQFTHATYPYPISVWRIAGLSVVFLAGEPTVGYAHRLKNELNVSWIVGYSDDVMGYVGTADVLREGKREGSERAAWYYGLPATWHTDVEDMIVQGVAKIL